MDFSVLETAILSLTDREQGSGASVEEIGKAEQRLGLNLTGGYRQFLEKFGWLGVGAIEIYGLGGGVPKHLDLVAIALSERMEMRPRLRPSLIPVMNDGGGNLYCVETAAGANSPVVFWDHELDEAQKPEIVSRSFEEWLHGRLTES